MYENHIFALDIGTRKVMGLVAVWEDGGLRVLDSEVLEHPTRAMRSGQIQDVRRVAEVVSQVTSTLSRRTGLALGQVAVAVAGRNLKTARGRAGIELARGSEIDRSDVERCALEALQDAQGKLGTQQEDALRRYHCVGYVVTEHLLDGEPLPMPAGHLGEKLETEVLATFLPKRVLESLLAALSHCNLQAMAITLEPIAALQAAVPEAMRRFHLALVDVGAGTSDIAIVRGGAVGAFGMVPCAGDFITEALSDLYLLDFFTAERVKRSLSEGKFLGVEDIFGKPHLLDPCEVTGRLSHAVSSLAREIADHIRNLGSGETPQAVICVGGGSLTPGLGPSLAEALGISHHRVGMRGPASGIHSSKQWGPEAVTPLGIAMVANSRQGLVFKRIFLNEQSLYLLEMGKPLTVFSALMAAGTQPREIYGQPGMSKTYTLNGKLQVLKGIPPTPALVELNGLPAESSQEIGDGDRIRFVEAKAGSEACATLEEVLGAQSRLISINGIEERIYPKVSLDGSPADLKKPLPDRARLEWSEWPTLREVLSARFGKLLAGQHVTTMVNGRSRSIVRGRVEVRLNGEAVDLDRAPESGDVVEVVEIESKPLNAQELIQSVPMGKPLRIRLNGREVIFPGRPGQVLNRGVPVELDAPLQDGTELEIIPGRDAQVMVVDLFRHLTISPQEAAGRKLRMFHNGEAARFTTPVENGAEVKVFFE